MARPPTQIIEFHSYSAIVACVAAGTGIALVPRSILQTLQATAQLQQHPLPKQFSINHTHLLWHQGHTSQAFKNLYALLPRMSSHPYKKPSDAQHQKNL